jgi:hypothetical protein
MVKTSVKIIIDKELISFLLPLDKEEFSQLEQSILAEGCRDALVVWERSPSENILVDGHNRYKICTENNIPFESIKMEFANIDGVKEWMIDNQLGRRNLNPDQLSYYRGLKYLSLKKKKGGYDSILSKGQIEPSTSETLSTQFKVSESTIKRDSKFAEGLNIIGVSNPQLKMKILSGGIKIKKSDIQVLSEMKEPSKIIIKNEADLLNKARKLKNEILDEVETRIQIIENERTEASKESIRLQEPLFLERNDRLIKIKGMILAAINRAINDRNIDAIHELRQLIERLEHELFD